MKRRILNRKGLWTTEELRRLADLYPRFRTDDVAALIGRSYDACETKASQLGLKKDPAVMAKIRQDAQRRQEHREAAAAVVASMAPEKPMQQPEVALKGVVYGVQKREPGVAVNGDRLAREIASRT